MKKIAIFIFICFSLCLFCSFASAQDFSGYIVLEKDNVRVAIKASVDSLLVREFLEAGFEQSSDEMILEADFSDWCLDMRVEEATDGGYGIAIPNDDCVFSLFFHFGEEKKIVKILTHKILVADDHDWYALE